MTTAFRVQSLLSARLLVSPQLVGERVFFLSDMSGRMSLYAMDRAGSLPEPLLPPNIALQNPALMSGESYFVFPDLDRILVMIDRDGDENYQPCVIPLDGGVPEPLFGDRFAGQQVNCGRCDRDRLLAAFNVDPRTGPEHDTYIADMMSGELTHLGTSIYGNWFAGVNDDWSKVVLIDGYTAGDHVLYLWERGAGERRVLHGKPIEERAEGEEVPLSSIYGCSFSPGDRGLLFTTSLFEDTYGLGYLALDGESEPEPVVVEGVEHTGVGELYGLQHLDGDRFLVAYNIDGCSHAYEGSFDEAGRRLRLDRMIVGTGPLAGGVLQSIDHDKASGDFVATFSTATSPAQLYLIAGQEREVVQLSRERVLGIPGDLLAPGEDASYTSHDGLRVSARLYLPASGLGFEGPRPVVFYIHGGPQSQERPDFTWFSMPLIQYMTLSGLAVFVPNVRGSSGYGLEYMKRVDKDWGGLDRLDHVAAFEPLRADGRLDTDRAGVMGRSYGGYMTLTLAGRHPELWRAACDMFGPYNLFTFVERLPETWQTFFHLILGHPERDHDFLVERSPSTYLGQLACPMLVVQGKNDPRVREAESRDVVDELRSKGKEIEYLMFEDEGHDVLKHENKVRCYEEITSFFVKHLAPRE